MTNPLTKLSQWLKAAKEGIQDGNRRKEIDTLNKSFYLEEKNGRIWLLHNGVAIRFFSAEESQEKIVTMLHDCRQTAIAFTDN